MLRSIFFITLYVIGLILLFTEATMSAEAVDDDTKKNKNHLLNFVAIGDWGGQEIFPYYTLAQQKTAYGMGIIAETLNSQFVIALGDNFYHTGVINSNSQRFHSTFEQIYSSSSLIQIPWYVIGGNHDHYGNIMAQIDYSNKNENGRWKFPSLYHSHSFQPTDGSFTLDLILIDTIDLCGLNKVQNKSDEGYFDPLPPLSDDKELQESSNEQWEWIQKQMESSTADYLLVGGHYPIYSVCQHGPTSCLIDRLKPLLEQYHGHYLSGHDHCMVHFEENHVRHVLTGMGDECCYDATNLPNYNNNTNDDDDDDHHGNLNPKDPKALKWFLSNDNKALYQAEGGFTSFQTTAQEMKIQYHDHRGNVVFTADPIPPRTKSPVSFK